MIVKHCENAYLQQAYGLIATKTRTLRSRLPEENERVGHCQENHAAIVRLIRDSNVPAAQDALAVHIRDTRNSYIEASRGQSSVARVPQALARSHVDCGKPRTNGGLLYRRAHYLKFGTRV